MKHREVIAAKLVKPGDKIIKTEKSPEGYEYRRFVVTDIDYFPDSTCHLHKGGRMHIEIPMESFVVVERNA